MKRYALLSMVILYLLSTACKKDSKQPVVVNGILATKGAAVWSTPNVNTGFKPLATKDTLFITGQNGEEDIVIAIKQRGAGTYQPSEFKAYFYTTVGFDAVVSKYKLADVNTNSLAITEYDETNHAVKVTFDLTFKSTYTNNNSFPAQIIFTNGKLSATLSDVYMDPFR